MLDAGKLFTKGDRLAVEIENGIFVMLLVGHIYFHIVLGHIEPGVAGSEACVFFTAPLYGRTGGVTAAVPLPLQALLGRTLGTHMEILPAGLYILIHLRVAGIPVGHTDLLALVNEGRTL